MDARGLRRASHGALRASARVMVGNPELTLTQAPNLNPKPDADQARFVLELGMAVLQHGQSARLGSAPAWLLCLLLSATGSWALARGGPATATPATASERLELAASTGARPRRCVRPSRCCGSTRTSSRCPTPSRCSTGCATGGRPPCSPRSAAACPMPHAPCPAPHARCPMPNVRCEQVDGRFPEAAPRECGKVYSDDTAQWGASAGTWKLCSGLFLLQPGNASLDFVDRWAERLANKQAGAKNQPHYNAALAQSNLSATVLPCDLFPNGHRPQHQTAAQTPT